MQSTLHQHIFRDRFYEVNELGMTIADWAAKVLDGASVHVGTP